MLFFIQPGAPNMFCTLLSHEAPNLEGHSMSVPRKLLYPEQRVACSRIWWDITSLGLQ